MSRGANGLLTMLAVLIAVGVFGTLLWRNADDEPELIVILPTQLPPTEDPDAWQNVLRRGFGSDSTPLPTIAIPTQRFEAPTLPPTQEEDSLGDPILPATINARPTESFSIGSTPTPAPEDTEVPDEQSTEDASEDEASEGAPVFTEQAVEAATKVWQPPPLVPPLSRDPFGRDHYWLSRPVDSDATNFGLFYYPYGSDGPNSDNPWRVHHGIDMPNPVGETVRAAGSGRVVWAANSLRIDDSVSFQNSPSYGNVVMIEHDFSYKGQPIFTLYAHLSAVLAEQGQLVNRGDVIGLVGDTGRVSGPHVHFEVRMGDDRYGSTYNPVLWMVPYVGHGVIAGRVMDSRETSMQDLDITLRRWSTGLVEDSTTSYIYLDTPSDVNEDPVWQENFVFADVPEGRYEVVAIVNGRRVSKIVDVQEGTTTFVELKPEVVATPQNLPSPTPAQEVAEGE